MKKHHPYGIVDPTKIIEAADIILDEFFQIAKKVKIRAYLAYGTCLGFVRDNGYIEGDNDLDVIVVTNLEQRKRLFNTLLASGFSKGKSYRSNHNTHFYKEKVLLDIYFREPGLFYRNIDYTEYKGKQYPIPHPYEDYLKACYSNWRVREDRTGKTGV